MNLLLILFSSLLFLTGTNNNTKSSGAVKLQIESKSNQGAYYIKLVSTDGKTEIRRVVGVHSKQQVLHLKNLPEGWYTIAVFHDINGNGELDKNFVGAPKEPYGFSNNARGIFGPPSVDEQRFYVSDCATQAIQLE